MAKLDDEWVEESLRLWEEYFAATNTTWVESSLGGFWEVIAAIRQIAARYGWRTRRRHGRLWFTREGRRFYITYPATLVRRSNVTDLKAVLREIRGD
jgi:hypothetical protein